MGKLVANIIGLFVGENSKKRQTGLMIAGALMLANLSGVLDDEMFKLLMEFDAIFLGLAFSAKLSKLTKATLKLKE